MKRTNAFTLVELLVVIAIIGILSGIGSVSYSGVQQRGRDAQRKNDLSQIKIALSTYYNAQVPATYPVASSKLTITGTSDALSTALKPSYIKSMPQDPLNTGFYVYKYQSLNSAVDYKLFGTLENKNDKKGWTGGSSWLTDGFVVENE